ncbi:MAG: 23S rRNA (adenine(2503)-C(2))-methyltransferase RlmN [Pseudomonadota bacterium]|nr:23S rRNA (adenine(2503)-C(2))-methyltransferase RlmN [Pseudomonadota bacterium]
MPVIYNYTRNGLEHLMSQLGEKPFRAQQIMRWVYHQSVDSFEDMVNIPKALRQTLAENFTFELPQIEKELISNCGTTKWLFHFGDKNAFETVYIPESNRGTLCISSQIGCALACQFCATGMAGFYKNLTTAQIIGQVFLARSILAKRTNKKHPITNVVFMGMGEPLLNEQQVFDAVSILLDDLAFGLSKYKVTISTSGITPAMRRMVEQTHAALAVSLHAGEDSIRSHIVPINKKYPLSDLMQACDHYTQSTKRLITYEYVMLKGINDQEQHAKALVKLLKHRHAKVNLIPYNPIPELDLKCSTANAIDLFCQHLLQNQIRCTVRKTRGDDIYAACGQLSGSVFDRKKSIAPYLYLRERSN